MQPWHLWHWTGSGGALGYFGRRGCLLAGVALGDIDLHFAWQAWRLVTSTVTLHGRRGTYGTGLALVARLGLRLAPLSPRLLAWQVWHLVTSTVTLRGRRGTWRHRPSLCVVGVALMALDWLWWQTKLFHTTLSQIPFTHNFVTQAFHTHNFVTHNSFTHNFVTHTTLSHTTLSHTTLSHTSLSHTIFYTQLCHIQLFHTQHFYIHKLTHTHNTVTHTRQEWIII